MKILRLSLNNLASLAGTHHIQFDSAPLAHAGLIAITGKTGAGKSTLLDAMCLALYNEVPRLSGAAGSLKDVGGQDISIKDSKNILRRGTTSGFAELEFIALDGKRYQARWEIRRARNKVDGNLKVERAITCLDDQVLLNHKISEATPIVEKLIGLSFEQFTRAVLLAQSEVGAFLKAKDHERADLLEYLTNSHIFSLVSIKAAEKFSQVKQQRIELENLIGHIEMLSQEEIEQLQQQQAAQSLQLQNLQQAEKLLDNEKKWHLDRDRMYADVQGKKEVYDVQLDAVQKSVAQQQLLEYLDQFQSVREQFIQRSQLQPKKQQILTVQHTFQAEFAKIQQQLATEQSKLVALKQQQQQFQKTREDIRPHLEAGLKLDHEINSITTQYKKIHAEHEQFEQNRIQPLMQQIQQHTSQLHSTQTQISHTQQQLDQTSFLQVFDQEPQSTLQALAAYAKQQQILAERHPEHVSLSLGELEQQINIAQQQLKAWSAEHQSVDQLEQQLTALQQQHSTLQQQRYQLDALQRHIVQLAEQMQQAAQLEDDLKTQQNQYQIEQSQLQQLQHNLVTEQQSLQQLEQVLAQQRLLHAQSVQELRAQLQTDQPCMVCGSHEHPYADPHAVLEQGLQQLHEQQLNDARDQYQHFLKQQQQQHIQLSKRETLIEQQQQHLVRLNQQNTAARQHTFSQLNECGLNLKQDADIGLLQNTVEQRILEITKQTETLYQQEKTMSAVLQQWRSTAQQLQQHSLLQQQHLSLQQLIEPIQQKLPEPFNTQAPRLWLKDIQQQLQQRLAHINAHKQLDNALLNQQQQLEKIQYQLHAEQQYFDKLRLERDQLIEHGKMLRAQLSKLTSDYAGQAYRVAAEWQNALEQQAKDLQQQLEAQQHKTAQAETQLNQANLKLQSLVTQLQQLEQQLEQTEHSIQLWQLNHPQISFNIIEQCLTIDLNEHQAIRHQLNNQKQLLENAKTAWNLLEEQYQAHLKLQPEHDFEQIEQALNTLSEEKTEQQNRLNEIAAKLGMNANNQATYAKYQSKIEHIKAEEYRWGRIYDLIGHKEGTKFKKIAQEHHLDILVEYANQQLQPLAPRYQLHRVPNSLSLAIIDLDMNSEVRPVLSLSGGETFLVSLALALAIANMASGSMKLESLFIDEGFGTLDPASLHMVMNALDHLQSQGRKVVLISHVQEMHERIPVQIQVKPLGSGASTLHIVG
ncbi:AAA family ATPase [Acinetobacter sp. 187]|uniref:AAA family ATPase n=1 Tax=Acinetobacter lanii TaxID=2715163 RepID=UPI00140BE53F|nr:AAA family ATPase [Acinetobacter lanii]NHC04562.1 AAA family ATPase [Acinetobacter lanii]